MHSDLDLFILGKTENTGDEPGQKKRLLSNLDEICLKAKLIQITREGHIPEFSGDGRYLLHYTVHELVSEIGTPLDDAKNTLTARLLLLLESRPLLGDDVYSGAVKDVIAAYWRDYPNHSLDFMPAFLANDILRLWRTFCVNYEARTQNVSAPERIKRRVKNYKLKHSRLLTCYSALMYMLFVYSDHDTVKPEDIVEMIGFTPTERLEQLSDKPALVKSRQNIIGLLERYEEFLKQTNRDEKSLTNIFSDKDKSMEYMNKANNFGDAAFDALRSIGEQSRFYRLLVV